MPQGIATLPRTWAADVETTNTIHGQIGTIPTTGTAEILLVAPVNGRVRAAYLTSIGALATDDTNYFTVTILNRTKTDADIALPTASASANSTKITGGSAIVARTGRAITLNTDVSKRAVSKGDVISVLLTMTGTLSGTVAGAAATLLIDRTD